VTEVVEFDDGVAIRGTFPDEDVLARIVRATGGNLPLVIADPPYGNVVDEEWDDLGEDDEAVAEWMIDWTRRIEAISCPRAALYVWGGIGRPLFRPFYRYFVAIERRSGYRVANQITWKKKRAYGIQHNYLFTREELLYMHLGEDIKQPRCFNIPLLDEKRGYAGYNKKYPAKSEFYRRSNVWDDVTEILRDKLHIAQKAGRLHEVPIEVHTHPGEWVLDPFVASGTTAVAARKLGRRFVVVEQDPATFEEMVARLRSSEWTSEQKVRPKREPSRKSRARKASAAEPLDLFDRV